MQMRWLVTLNTQPNTPMAIKENWFPWKLTLFQSPPSWFKMLVIFSLKNVKQDHKLELTYLYACWIVHMGIICKYQNGMPKVARKAFNIEEVRNPGNKDFYLLLSNPTAKNQTFLIKVSWDIFFHHIWLKVWCHHLANLHISGMKKNFKRSKQHFSSHADYLFMC